MPTLRNSPFPSELDALVNNLFKGNATVIGEWATASHVERQGTRKAKPATGSAAPAPKP